MTSSRPAAQNTPPESLIPGRASDDADTLELTHEGGWVAVTRWWLSTVMIETDKGSRTKPRVSDGALRHAATLASLPTNAGGLFPSRETLAELEGVSVDRIDARTHELVAAGVLTVQHRLTCKPCGTRWVGEGGCCATCGRVGKRTSNLYRLETGPTPRPVRTARAQAGAVETPPVGPWKRGTTKNDSNNKGEERPATVKNWPGIGAETATDNANHTVTAATGPEPDCYTKAATKIVDRVNEWGAERELPARRVDVSRVASNLRASGLTTKTIGQLWNAARAGHHGRHWQRVSHDPEAFARNVVALSYDAANDVEGDE